MAPEYVTVIPNGGTEETELACVDHKWHYKLLKVNGQAADLARRIKRVPFKSAGEFGSSLHGIFDPKANAGSTLRSQSALVLGLLGKTWTKEEIQFQDYRKYDANSTVKFDEPNKQ